MKNPAEHEVKEAEENLDQAIGDYYGENTVGTVYQHAKDVYRAALKFQEAHSHLHQVEKTLEVTKKLYREHEVSGEQLDQTRELWRVAYDENSLAWLNLRETKLNKK